MVGRIEGSVVVELDLPMTKATRAVQRAQSALRSEGIVDVAVVEPRPALSCPSRSSSASRSTSSAAVSNEAPPHPFYTSSHPTDDPHDPPRPVHDPFTTPNDAQRHHDRPPPPPRPPSEPPSAPIHMQAMHGDKHARPSLSLVLVAGFCGESRRARDPLHTTTATIINRKGVVPSRIAQHPSRGSTRTTASLVVRTPN